MPADVGRDVDLGWPSIGVSLNVIGQETLNVSNAAVGLTDAGFTAVQIARAKHGMISVQGADIRFSTDGSDATAADADVIEDGGGAEWLEVKRNYSSILRDLSMFRDAAADATVKIRLYD